MTLSKAVELQSTFATAVSSAYSESFLFASTVEEHCDRMNRYVYGRTEYKKSPRWLKEAIRAVDSTHFNALYSVRMGFQSRNTTPELLPVLEAINVGPDGKMFRESDDSWLQESSDYKTAMTCKHVWRARMDKGEFKPW